MAITIKSYYKTTELTQEQLAQAVKSCETQDYQVYQLYKTFGTLTPEDVWELYCELVNPIRKTSAGRSNNTLVKNGVIREIGNVIGPYGRPVKLYEIVDNPPTELKSFNKTFPKTFSLDLVLTEDGNIDTEKIVENLDLVLSNISRKFNISY